jgi:hypothetical protein
MVLGQVMPSKGTYGNPQGGAMPIEGVYPTYVLVLLLGGVCLA